MRRLFSPLNRKNEQFIGGGFPAEEGGILNGVVTFPGVVIHREIQIGSLPLLEIGGQNRVFGKQGLGGLENL